MIYITYRKEKKKKTLKKTIIKSDNINKTY